VAVPARALPDACLAPEHMHSVSATFSFVSLKTVKAMLLPLIPDNEISRAPNIALLGKQVKALLT
jgi:hypothetical protein